MRKCPQKAKDRSNRLAFGSPSGTPSCLELLSSGMEIKEILVEYPFLEKGQVQAAIDYAKTPVGKEESYIFDKSRSIHS